MKRLRLIATGGTIACVPSEQGLVPELTAKELLSFIDAGEFAVDCVDLFNMDSSNIQPEEWRKMAGKILKSSWDYDGIVITHGTDTMAYTSSMLSFMLRNISVPVVLTGSQYPIIRPDSDGRVNLKNALVAASALRGGVYVAFGDAVIKGCRAVKTRTTSLNAFESINYPYEGTVVNGRYYELLTPEEVAGEFEFFDAIDPHVALVKLIPGTSPEVIESLLSCDIHGVVVEAFGLGGVHNVRRDHAESIKKLVRNGLPVILASQCLYEQSSTDTYQVSFPLREEGVISAADMTTEAAVTKLMWALGKTDDMEELSTLIRTDICGEISV